MDRKQKLAKGIALMTFPILTLVIWTIASLTMNGLIALFIGMAVSGMFNIGMYTYIANE